MVSAEIVVLLSTFYDCVGIKCRETSTTVVETEH